MYENHYKSSKSISDIVCKTDIGNGDSVKRSKLFLEWVEGKAVYFEVEKSPLIIPDTVYPEKITEFAYNKNKSFVKTLIDKYYSFDSSRKEYINRKTSIDENDKLEMLHNLVFLRGKVVWVDFGFNIGCEFGGKHPAIILKNIKKALIVAPLTSGKPTGRRKSEVKIDIVYNLPIRERYTNVTRITPISIYRVDLNSPVGSINSANLKGIFEAMRKEWGFN